MLGISSETRNKILKSGMLSTFGGTLRVYVNVFPGYQ